MKTALLDCLDGAVKKNSRQQIQFLQQLVRAKSANPYTPETSDPEDPIEREVAYLIRDKLSEVGLQPQLKGVSRHRPNVLARLRGSKGKRALILNGHMDTVMPSPQWKMDPFAGTINRKRLFGLGAVDMKASLSVFIFAAKALLECEVKLGGDLILTFVVDEEPGGYSRFGTRYLLDNGLSGTAAIVGEPGNTNVSIGHRGGYRFKLMVRGTAAHTGTSVWEHGKKGKNAIVDMARAIAALSNLELPYYQTPAFPNRRSVFTFPTLIDGGTSINVVPDECVGYGDIRLLPGCDAEEVEGLIRERINEIPDLEYSLEQLLFVPAVEIPADEEIVRILVQRTTEVTGKTPSSIGSGPWNDGWMFITRGIPAVCAFGPQGKGVHAPDEFVYVDSLIETTRIYIRAILDYLVVST